MTDSKIIWTKIDEAPALATYALLPVVKAFCKACDIEVETKDISLAGRIIANIDDNLTLAQKQEDALEQLGTLAKSPQANIIKLPNISATIPQLQSAIDELKAKGYDLPDYPQEAKTSAEKALQARFAKVLGSAVNPVLREGNSDRRAAASVKTFANKHPHKMMQAWPRTGSKAEVVHMNQGDFFASEQSVVMTQPGDVNIKFTDVGGNVTMLKERLSLLAGEVIDSAVMSIVQLRKFYADQIAYAKKEGTLFSLHLKATMMKVSDPIMFGHCVSVFYKSALDKHKDTLASLGVNLKNGLEDVYLKINKLEPAKKAEIEADFAAVYQDAPALAMVDSRNGITNLHAPNKVIIDASMPNIVRDGGKMWNNANQLQDTLALIPDRSYATIYKEIIEDCKRNGQFDPATMGSVANVGLMAQKAEEYGSHDKTFEMTANGKVEVIDANGKVIMSHQVEIGDIYRMCQAKDAPIKNWVGLAVRRARITGSPTIFWLDPVRAHDRAVIAKVNLYLAELDTEGLDIQILNPVAAMKFSVARVRKGQNTISVTGNVLRDYLTDLFPILELGTSARMLSIVPLMNGGGMYETGAGGSAPKHVQQFLNEGHLRWDSLGEYCALVPSFEQIASKGNPKAKVLAAALNEAIITYLENSKSPLRKVNQPDNRNSSFYLSLYWAQALAKQTQDLDLQKYFTPISAALSQNEALIAQELLAAQGQAVDIGGYFKPVEELAQKAMRPSLTFNAIIDAL